MPELQKKYHEAGMEINKELYERQIKIVDAQIDRDAIAKSRSAWLTPLDGVGKA